MRHVATGFRLVFEQGRYVRFALVPTLISGGLWLGAMVLLFALIQTELHRFLARLPLPGWMVAVAGTLIFAVAFVYLAAFLFLWIAAVTNSLLWRGLAGEIERTLTGSAPDVKVSFGSSLGDTVSRSTVVVLAAVVATGCGWALLGLPGLFFGSVISLTDYTSAYYLRRGITYGGQVGQVFRLPGWFGFALCGGLLTLVPFVNIFMLPVLVAGGTAMAVEGRLSGRNS